MRFINSFSTDAGFNLAAEEYLLKQGTEDAFMLWQSAPSIIISKHQWMEAEVNLTTAGEEQIPVSRRFSDGDAVYYDLGNISLTLTETTRLVRLEVYLEETITMLSAAGVTATGDERLGIYVGGRKVSGSVQCAHRNRAMYYCTLLYDTDLKLLNTLLIVVPSEENIRLHPSICSVRSEVTNLKKCFYPAIPTDRFRNRILRYFAEISVSEGLNRAEQTVIEELRGSKHNVLDEESYRRSIRPRQSKYKAFSSPIF